MSEQPTSSPLPMPYREPGETDRIGALSESVDHLRADIGLVLREVKKPNVSGEGQFWLSLWPRVLWPCVGLAVVFCTAGYACNREDNHAKVEAARVNGAEAAKFAAHAAQDGGVQ